MLEPKVLECVVEEIIDGMASQISELKESIKSNPNYVKLWISENLYHLFGVACHKIGKTILLTNTNTAEYSAEVFKELEKVLFKKSK